MKYIRTKDGIWQYYQENNSAERPNKEFKCNQIWLNIKEQDIIKQADTIEELCDEFVIEYPSGEFDTLNHDYSARLKYMGIEQYNAEINHGWCKLYGAIWTGKGLIYVAKMNDSGVLELL